MKKFIIICLAISVVLGGCSGDNELLEKEIQNKSETIEWLEEEIEELEDKIKSLESENSELTQELYRKVDTEKDDLNSDDGEEEQEEDLEENSSSSTDIE